MNHTSAQKLLDLPAHATPQAIRDAYARRASQLGRERELAITRSLRERVEQELAAIRAARDQLLGARDHSVAPESAEELPLTSPPPASPAAARTPLPFSTTGNSRVLDRYDLGEKLGSGGMGEVFAAFDRLTSQPVAIKFISERISSRADSLQRFLAEARMSCRLSHPNIVRTFDVHESAGRYFITMELLEGHSLRQHIASRIAAGRAFERAEVGRILHQICAALAYAHKDLVHRDIKPENVWRCTDGTIKIMDFGVALDMAGADLAEASAALGTEGYRAPEQTTGSDLVDQRADQYSAACIAVELLAAPAPCRPAQIRTDAIARRDPVRAVLERALAGRASERYDTILAFESAFRGALLQARWRRHLPWVVAALALLLAFGAARLFREDDPATAPSVATAPSLTPALQAHARLSEARALLAAMDTLVERTQEEVDQLRTDLERAQQRAASGQAEPGDGGAAVETQRQALEDAKLLAARASGWALMGDDRIRVEGHVGAAEAALEGEQWEEAANQSSQALERLADSRAALVATREELEQLRQLATRIDSLQQDLGPATQSAAALNTLMPVQEQLRAAREALVAGNMEQARELRLALTRALQTAAAEVDTTLSDHWMRESNAALRAGQTQRARNAITALEALGTNPNGVEQLRRELAVMERRMRDAEAARRQQQQEAEELEREQENYRPRRQTD